MYWEERAEEKAFDIPDDVIELSFKIECKNLPLDHAWALSGALCERFPWLETTEQIGIHQIHGAETGNGWVRPDNPESDLIHLSRRVRFTLRLPKTHLKQADDLPGTELDINGHALKLGQFKQQLLIPQTTLFARYVESTAEQSDDEFLQQAAKQIQALDIHIHKMLSGSSHIFNTPNGKIHNRKLMLADLEKEESIRLQQIGIGQHQLQGIGLFLPHKGIQPAAQLNEDLMPFINKG